MAWDLRLFEGVPQQIVCGKLALERLSRSPVRYLFRSRSRPLVKQAKRMRDQPAYRAVGNAIGGVEFSTCSGRMEKFQVGDVVGWAMAKQNVYQNRTAAAKSKVSRG